MPSEMITFGLGASALAKTADITNSGQIKGFIVLTQAAYDALTTPDPEIVYLIRG